MFKNLLLALLVLLPCIFAENLPEDCAQAARTCNRSGVYLIQPRPQGDVIFNPFKVYCLLDSKGGDAWTVFQRRQNGQVSFYRDWDDYKYGFGMLNEEFWLGLDNIHALTNDLPQELWIKLIHPNGTSAYATYTEFAVGNEDQNYPLSVLGAFDGTAGDSFRPQRGMQFSTKNKKHDQDPGRHCAQKFTGAWWYRNCYESNLNGIYGEKTNGKGVTWKTFANAHTSLKYTHMAIRSKNCRC